VHLGYLFQNGRAMPPYQEPASSCVVPQAAQALFLNWVRMVSFEDFEKKIIHTKM
jgi:hypothetical protein